MRKKRYIATPGITLAIGVMVFAVMFHTPKPVHPEQPIGEITSKPHSGTVQASDEPADGITPTRVARILPTNEEKPQTDTHVSVTKPQDTIVTIDNKQYPLRTYRPVMAVNDPYANQWWESQAKINTAWDVPRGNNPTTLAIIDTGFALGHQEFTDRWYSNSGETGAASAENPSTLNCADRSLSLDASCNLIDDDFDRIVDNEAGAVIYQNSSRRNCTDQAKPLTKDCNLIDDDANGYVDDVRGWDFINYDNSVQAGELNPAGSGTYHGTMVAGIAAATGNNGVGMAGVDWGTTILPIQALDDDSYGDTRSVGRAIYYAVEQNVDVISLSLGSDAPDDYIRQAVHAALERGITVVAASGNDGCDCMVYPARYPEVVAVGAHDSNQQPASFSSWGSSLDVLAPGTGMTSAAWTASSPSTAYASGINGTSFATPMISGLMTRLLSQQPTMTPQQLIAAVTETTNRIYMTSSPYSSTRGFGTLDAQKASSRLATPLASSQIYAFAPTQMGSYLIPGTILEPGGSYSAYSCETNAVASTPIYELAKGSSMFFTISKIEQQKALEQGYTSKLFSYSCLTQPHDRPVSVRNINVFREFYNREAPR